RQLRAIERRRQRLRLTDAGADDDELLHALDAAQELGGGALERGGGGLRIGRLDAGAPDGAGAGAVPGGRAPCGAGGGRLRRFEAALMQSAPQQLLAVQRLAVDQLEQQRLSASFHRRTWTLEYTSIFIDRICTGVYTYSLPCIQ